MTDNPTRILNQQIGLGDNPDEITYTVDNTHVTIYIGPLHIAVTPSSQAALNKLATVVADATATLRGRTLREVAA